MNNFNSKKHKPIFEVFIISILFYLVHKLFFYLNRASPNFQDFRYPIETVYGFFFISSLLILFILIQVKIKNIDNVGYTFLLVTGIKIGLSFAFLSGISNRIGQNIRFEKINFFVIFALFLAIETTVTIRMLNNKQ